MAMRVAGAMTLGELIEEATSKGCSVVQSNTKTIGEFGEISAQRYLVRKGYRAVPLPHTPDNTLMLPPERVNAIKYRLGL